jgi:hypothetical protein
MLGMVTLFLLSWLSLQQVSLLTLEAREAEGISLRERRTLISDFLSAAAQAGPGNFNSVQLGEHIQQILSAQNRPFSDLIIHSEGFTFSRFWGEATPSVAHPLQLNGGLSTIGYLAAPWHTNAVPQVRAGQIELSLLLAGELATEMIDLIQIPFFRPFLHAYGLPLSGRVPRTDLSGLAEWYHSHLRSGKTVTQHREDLEDSYSTRRLFLRFDRGNRHLLPDRYLNSALHSWVTPEWLISRDFQETIESIGPVWSFAAFPTNPVDPGLIWNEESQTLFVYPHLLEVDVLTIADPLGGGKVVLVGEEGYIPPYERPARLISFRSFHDEPTRVELTSAVFHGITLFTTHSRLVSQANLLNGRVTGGFFGNIFLHPYATLEGDLALQGGLAFYWEAPPTDLHLDVPQIGSALDYRDLPWDPLVTYYFRRR